MEQQNDLKPQLIYEETPVMEPIEEPKKAMPVPPPPRPRRAFPLRNLVLLLLVLAFAFWFSTRPSQISTSTSVIVPSPTLLVTTPMPSREVTPQATPIIIPDNWIGYNIAGGTYKLPPEMKEPVCDGGGCISYGANMPGGTRLTISPRGKGQRLPDFRNAILTDAGGRKFVMSLLTLGDREVYEYVGDFTGSTIQGFSFSKIRGLLVSINDTSSVEFNHFSPAGKTADFAADDVIFTMIAVSFRP